MIATSENIKILKKIKECESKLLKAVKNKDLESLDELIHDDLLFILPGGHTVTKTMDLEAHRSGQMSVDDITSHEQLIHILGDTAVASVLIELKGKYMGQALDGNYRYLRVWKLFNDKWKIIAGSCTPL